MIGRSVFDGVDEGVGGTIKKRSGTLIRERSDDRHRNKETNFREGLNNPFFSRIVQVQAEVTSLRRAVAAPGRCLSKAVQASTPASIDFVVNALIGMYTR